MFTLCFLCTYFYNGDGSELVTDSLFSSCVLDIIRRWAQQVYEDIYIAIYKTDGYDSAMALRSRITERMARGSGFENYQNVSQSNQRLGHFLVLCCRRAYLSFGSHYSSTTQHGL